ncbi:glycosyl hydrolase 115 family protein [Hymenobacter sp. BT188]|nr:glycosyl hydrolase 115 family protein [Hymenobacter sp. BT188]
MLLVLLAALPTLAGPTVPGAEVYVSTQKGKGGFTLAAGGKTAPLYASNSDWPGVLRAAKDLQADINRVTKLTPTFTTDKAPAGKEVVLIGTLGKSPLIDGLVKTKKLDVSGVAGKWETFVLQVVEKPMPGVERALVIAGSDKRGTIFGIYDLSAQIGVSPWYWWADVPTPQQQALYVAPGRHTQGEPKVKYRGIFLNDEAPALSGWAKEKFGGINSKMYVHVFELILRLKGNYLWPAMWGNAFNDDDKQSPVLADEYGIVMGTSHHEPMVRSQQEWKRFGSGPWNYQTNEKTLQDFWRQGIRNMGTKESIITVGMRGDGDEPMSEGSNITLLEKIVADQRKIIAEETGKPAEQTPQMWALYKEVQDYYDKGMRVPDDVTLLLCDDNWGNLRKLPKLGDKPRKGGYGIYYHYDYVGGPRNYKWLNTNPIPRIWEQMHLAHEYGANQIWIVNVGDLKPMEFPISFFLDYAWNPDKIGANQIDDYTRQWAAQQFGNKHAAAIADILAKYAKYNSRRKPELLNEKTYSLTNYREFETVVADYNKLLVDAEQLNEKMPPEHRDAYFQLVLHPVKAGANLNEMYYTIAQNHLYAQQGRASTNDLATKAKQLFERDAEISRYYNQTMAKGKWNHMMDQTHIGYTYWQQPPADKMPEVKQLTPAATADMSVAIEGAEAAWPQQSGEAVLPTFNSYQQPTRYIDVFNRGTAPFEYTVQTGSPWLRVTKPAKLDKEQRLLVSVDWGKAPAGTTRVPITISGPNNKNVVVQAVVENAVGGKSNLAKGFVETDGFVSIEAEHYSQAVYGSNVKWQTVPDLGRTLSGVTVFPRAIPSQTPAGNSPHLEYKVQLTGSGPVTVQAYLAPTLDFTNTTGLRYAVSFDDEAPQLVNLHTGLNPDNGNRPWEQAVANNIIIKTSTHTLAKPGEHVLKFWLVDPGVVLQKLVVDWGGVKPSYLGPPESFSGATPAPKAAEASKGSVGRR